MLKIIAIIFLVFSTAPTALALDLYSGEVTVQDQGVAERANAVPAALIQVLQKLSGRRELPLTPSLDSALASADGMLVSFHYREHERSLPDGAVNAELRLVASFFPAAVDRVLQELELPRWRQARQPIVIWVVVDDGRSRSLQPPEFLYAWDAMEDIASLRGLPVAWPGLSEELKQQIDLQLLWGGYTEQLFLEGSDSDGVVIVAARREGPEWNVRWNHSDGVETSNWRTRDRDFSFAMVEGIHHLAEIVATANSIDAAGRGEWQVEVRITGFKSAKDYARCLAYLQGLSLVDEVAVAQAGPDGIVFDLVLNAAPEFLAQFIKQDRILGASETDNEYHLLP